MMIRSIEEKEIRRLRWISYPGAIILVLGTFAIASGFGETARTVLIIGMALLLWALCMLLLVAWVVVRQRAIRAEKLAEHWKTEYSRVLDGMRTQP